jgi:uncharacterized coiled-coil protein SlyX
MTIKQYAEQQGISPQAVYQRLKKNGIRVDTLTEANSGELTGEGIIVLDKLFDPENRATKPLKDEKIEALEEQLTALKAEKAALQEKVDSLTNRVEELKQDKDNYFQALLKAQDTFSETMKLLPGTTGKGSDRLTWKERFTGRRKA